MENQSTTWKCLTGPYFIFEGQNKTNISLEIVVSVGCGVGEDGREKSPNVACMYKEERLEKV